MNIGEIYWCDQCNDDHFYYNCPCCNRKEVLYGLLEFDDDTMRFRCQNSCCEKPLLALFNHEACNYVINVDE
jgi:hypothetical protein